MSFCRYNSKKARESQGKRQENKLEARELDSHTLTLTLKGNRMLSVSLCSSWHLASFSPVGCHIFYNLIQFVVTSRVPFPFQHHHVHLDGKMSKRRRKDGKRTFFSSFRANRRNNFRQPLDSARCHLATKKSQAREQNN